MAELNVMKIQIETIEIVRDYFIACERKMPTIQYGTRNIEDVLDSLVDKLKINAIDGQLTGE